jgi:hypothetical protein
MRRMKVSARKHLMNLTVEYSENPANLQCWYNKNLSPNTVYEIYVKLLIKIRHKGNMANDIYCVVPVELFSYRERLLQQNGDIGKRDGVKTTCIWAHSVQGNVYSSPSPPYPPFSLPPSNVITINKGSRPARHFRPLTPPPPP